MFVEMRMPIRRGGGFSRQRARGGRGSIGGPSICRRGGKKIEKVVRFGASKVARDGFARGARSRFARSCVLFYRPSSRKIFPSGMHQKIRKSDAI